MESKYGVSHEQIVPAYQLAIKQGAQRFGLHTMIASNELDYRNIVETTRMILDIAAWVGRSTGIQFEFVNIGGGIGIPYQPDQAVFNLTAMAEDITRLFQAFQSVNGYQPGLSMECGRFMTGPHGALVTRAINHKSIYREYVGVDACMSALMRPAMYGAYHHRARPQQRHPHPRGGCCGCLVRKQ